MPQVLHEYALRHWWIEAKIVTGLRSNALFQTQVIFKTLHCPLSGLKRRGKGFIKTCAVYLDLTWQFGYYHCGCGVFYASEEGEKMWSPWICLVPALFAEVLCSSEAQALGYAQSFVNTKHFVKTGCSTAAPKVLLSLYSMLSWECFQPLKITVGDAILCQYFSLTVLTNGINHKLKFIPRSCRSPSVVHSLLQLSFSTSGFMFEYCCPGNLGKWQHALASKSSVSQSHAGKECDVRCICKNHPGHVALLLHAELRQTLKMC